jgi:hypothetical protein
MASGAAATAAGASVNAVGLAASSSRVDSGLGGVVTSGSGPLGPAAAGTGWGPDPPAGAAPADVLDASEERGLSDHQQG